MRYLFSSHDGYGLGHVRRNALVAAEILRQDPQAQVTLVTGVGKLPPWLDLPGLDVVRVPPLLKASDGHYRHSTLPFHEALAERSAIFGRAVCDIRPDVVVVDRHPFGTGGELRTGLRLARNRGAHVVLGLRDIIDDASVVRTELAGADWADVPQYFDQLLVFGDQVLCDHAAEYGLPLPVTYCGWAVEHKLPTAVEPDLFVVSAGGGGDGEAVFRLGVEVTRRRPELRTVIAAGPYAAPLPVDYPRELAGRIELRHDGGATGPWFARAGAVLQMAGYNSTVEALAAGVRPILVPRRAPRREQAIRAARLAALGLADIVDEAASSDEVAWLLDQPRRLAPDACAKAGIQLDGAAVAAAGLASRVLVSAA